MIKTSGYRVSPTEVEEVIYATGLVGEAAALGIPHPVLGQAIVVVATARDGVQLDTDKLLAQCRQQLPAFMVPARVTVREGACREISTADRPQAAGARHAGLVRGGPGKLDAENAGPACGRNGLGAGPLVPTAALGINLARYYSPHLL